MIFSKTSIEGLWVIDLEFRQDNRGFFARTYCENEFAALDLNTNWPQCNLTQTTLPGCIRGMHWQADPKPEIKLIRCVAGAIWDCLVDVRPASPTFGQWQAFELSVETGRMLYVEAGLAHGFQVLKPNSEVFYQMSEFYEAELARGFRWNDPAIGITWPLEPTMLSPRDQGLGTLSDVKEIGVSSLPRRK